MLPHRLFLNLSFRGNAPDTRYSWLRLTPAYSHELVNQLLAAYASPDDIVLDPFCGTGTTALACAARGLPCVATEINPFLAWLSDVKTRTYHEIDAMGLVTYAQDLGRHVPSTPPEACWVPPIAHRDRWWDPETASLLGALWHHIRSCRTEIPASWFDLLTIAFCRVMFAHARVHFRHQSLSVQPPSECNARGSWPTIQSTWHDTIAHLLYTLNRPSVLCEPRIVLHDARHLAEVIPAQSVSFVLTSPPYPNRMSYVREVRPYLYWLEYIRSGREAGELDWQAIGGTWGIATSRLQQWTPDAVHWEALTSWHALCDAIARHSPILGRYVAKYLVDMWIHVQQLPQICRRPARVCYIVGNAMFYGVEVPTPSILAEMLARVGFSAITSTPFRRRTSNRALYETLVTAQYG